MDDSIQKIIEEMRDAVWPGTPEGKELTAWADRLEVLARGIEADCAKIEAMIEMLR